LLQREFLEWIKRHSGRLSRGGWRVGSARHGLLMQTGLDGDARLIRKRQPSQARVGRRGDNQQTHTIGTIGRTSVRLGCLDMTTSGSHRVVRIRPSAHAGKPIAPSPSNRRRPAIAGAHPKLWALMFTLATAAWAYG